jgi:4-amino-4-deoxy-L-arabinose transferase-like glycosyltransferase
MKAEKFARPLWVVLAIALTLRLFLLSAGLAAFHQGHPHGLRTPDSQDYTELAKSLRKNGSLPPDGRSVFRLPGYPAILAATFHVSYRPVWALVQIAMDVALVALVYALGRDLLGRRVALVGALLQALSPLAMAASVRLLSDGPYATVFLLTVWLLVKHIRSGDRKWLIASAVAMAAACYIRPIGPVMAGAAVLFLLVRPGRRVKQALAYAAIVAVLLGPWVIRNGTATGYWGLSNNFSVTLFGYSAAITLETAEDRTPAEVQTELLSRVRRRLPPDEQDPDVGDLSAAYRSVAIETITSYPWTYARLHLGGSLAFWLPGATDVLEIAGLTTGQRGTLGVLRREGLPAAVEHYFEGDPAALALAGGLGLVYVVRAVGLVVFVVLACRWWRKLPAVAWWLIAVVVISWLIGGPVSTPRFRVPVEPLLSLAGAAGCVWLWRRRRVKRLS